LQEIEFVFASIFIFEITGDDPPAQYFIPVKYGLCFVVPLRSRL
jgi:hypothetical protein